MEFPETSSTSSNTLSHNQFLGNLLRFSRLLRQAGIPISRRQVHALLEGLPLIDVSIQQDFFYILRAFLVHDVRFYNLFAFAFEVFWTQRYEFLTEFGYAAAKKKTINSAADAVDEPAGGIHQKTAGTAETKDPQAIQDEQPYLYASATYSPHEILNRRNLDNFTEEEIEAGRSLLHTIDSRVNLFKSRRFSRAPSHSAQLDYRRSVRNSLKHGGELVELSWKQPKLKTRPVVLICDVSGSMERYSRLFLHFMYAWVQQNRKVEAFVFGTRLTRITPALRRREVDVVLKEISDLVFDWAGGTRIGESLKTFNYSWSRRILRRGSLVVILSDGWDRGNIPVLEREIGRLKRSAWKLIWINPLLDTPGYQPLARGMQTVLPYLDEFLPCQNNKNRTYSSNP